MATNGQGSTNRDRAIHHLKAAIDADETTDIDYHLRQAIQLLTLN